jgi:prepilin-type N-terminal cleavage/methylation domain-containing protein
LKTAGFSLLEVLVATAVVTVGVASLAQLLVVSARANRVANTTSATLLLAEHKMEELVGESDLSPSTPGTLLANTPGFIDYLDPNGVSLGVTSIVPPPGAVFICRWSIDPLPGSAANTLVLQVLVFSWPQNAAHARLVSVKFRRGS